MSHPSFYSNVQHSIISFWSNVMRRSLQKKLIFWLYTCIIYAVINHFVTPCYGQNSTRDASFLFCFGRWFRYKLPLPHANRPSVFRYIVKFSKYEIFWSKFSVLGVSGLGLVFFCFFFFLGGGGGGGGGVCVGVCVWGGGGVRGGVGDLLRWGYFLFFITLGHDVNWISTSPQTLSK